MPIHTDSGITDLHAEEFTEEQTVTQLVKKLPTFYETRMFITRAHH
jgi:hypothetical protein